MVDKALYFFEKDVGKKVYEMEYEVTYITKWQVLAENKDQAFDIWLKNHKIDIATEDGKDVVCSYVKDYTQIGSTKEIAKIKYNKEDDEVYAE
tara:strand:- start:261 stop:539 length:279 start_codon:yes stop_codon:yes gene_type:complete